MTDDLKLEVNENDDDSFLNHDIYKIEFERKEKIRNPIKEFKRILTKEYHWNDNNKIKKELNNFDSFFIQQKRFSPDISFWKIFDKYFVVNNDIEYINKVIDNGKNLRHKNIYNLTTNKYLNQKTNEIINENKQSDNLYKTLVLEDIQDIDENDSDYYDFLEEEGNEEKSLFAKNNTNQNFENNIEEMELEFNDSKVKTNKIEQEEIELTNASSIDTEELSLELKKLINEINNDSNNTTEINDDSNNLTEINNKEEINKEQNSIKENNKIEKGYFSEITNDNFKISLVPEIIKPKIKQKEKQIVQQKNNEMHPVEQKVDLQNDNFFNQQKIDNNLLKDLKPNLAKDVEEKAKIEKENSSKIVKDEIKNETKVNNNETINNAIKVNNSDVISNEIKINNNDFIKNKIKEKDLSEIEEFTNVFYKQTEVKDKDKNKQIHRQQQEENIDEMDFDPNELSGTFFIDNLTNNDKLAIFADEKEAIISQIFKNLKFPIHIEEYIISNQNILYKIKITDLSFDIQKIKAIENNLCLFLAINKIRLLLPIPNMPYIGIEIPHNNFILLHLKEILKTNKHHFNQNKIIIPLGRSTLGKIETISLLNNPLILINGDSQTGKTELIKTIIVSLLLQNKNDFKIDLIDFNKINASVFSQNIQIFNNLVTKYENLRGEYLYLKDKIENRINFFKRMGVQNIEQFNMIRKEQNKSLMQYHVVIISDFNSLSTYQEKFSNLIKDTRPLGIFYIISNLELDHEFLRLKNLASLLISFKINNIDKAKRFFNTDDPITLLGNGDMVLKDNQTSNITRYQTPLTSISDIKQIIIYFKTNIN